MFGLQIGDDWLDALYGRATEEVPVAPTPLPVWHDEIEAALKAGRIRDPFEEACKVARGE